MNIDNKILLMMFVKSKPFNVSIPRYSITKDNYSQWKNFTEAF